jgi:CTP:molybdopterin cytidylyltransferase MocA
VNVGGLVLAAGSSSRFGSPKALAELDGRPLLQHVLDAAAAAHLQPVIVVLGESAPAIERRIRWRTERRIRNPDPARGLSSSLRDGLADLSAIAPRVDAVVLLGDQPRTSPAVIRALVEAADLSDRPIVAPRYAAGGGSNPVFIRRDAFRIAREAENDRGLGPILIARPELVTWIDVEGSNPDVDTPADLLALQPAGR